LAKEDNFIKALFFRAFFLIKTIKFQPQLTQKKMLELGVFGGYYFEGNHNEYPKSWFKKAKISNRGYDVNLNYFKIRSGQPKRVDKKMLDNQRRPSWMVSVVL